MKPEVRSEWYAADERSFKLRYYRIKTCLNYPFDITDFQPQLFVAKNFEHLLKVLEIISKKMAFNRGGIYGVNQAIKSKALNTVVLDSGLQISGILEKTMQTKNKKLTFLKFSGPVQLSFENKQLKGHGKNYHKEGYSTPLRFLTKSKTPFHLWSAEKMRKQGLRKNKKVKMLFEGGIRLEGELETYLKSKGHLLLLSFKNCLIQDSNNILYHPSWGPFDLAVGGCVTSVFSGLADKKAYKQENDFEPSKIPQRNVTEKQKKSFKIYKKIANLKKLSDNNQLQKLLKELKQQENSWLMTLELLDFLKNKKQLQKQILDSLDSIKKIKIQNKKVFNLGKIFYKI